MPYKKILKTEYAETAFSKFNFWKFTDILQKKY